MDWIYVTENKKPKNNHYYWVCEKSFGSTTTIEAYYKNGKWYKDFYSDDFGFCGSACIRKYYDGQRGQERYRWF